ncbi:tyrosine-protein phosphatase [Fibrobacter sp.]|uniref:tyrosine-protein phosphatase n=1 Tax=Fibrobacter sp. TaxID=35828 RepID=UPI003865CA3F
MIDALGKKMTAFYALAFALIFAACGDENTNYFPIAPERNSSSETLSSSSANELVSVSTTIVEDTFEIYALGSVSLDVVADSFLVKFDYGDVVTVMIAGYDTMDVPVVANYSDAFPGEFFLYASRGLNAINLEARYGQMAEVIGLGRDSKFPIDVVVQMKEKGGYVDHLENLKSLSFAYSPESYPDLSIEEFANFRMVRTTGMGEGVLYRSSSPIDPSIHRSAFADSLAALAGIKTFVNLADDKRYAEEYDGFAESYYAKQNVVYLAVDPTFANTLFKKGLVKGLRYMIEHDGPYLLHCTYGMDRTGFTIAVLEALMGATADEIKSDYATTHKNFYNVIDGKHVDLTAKQVELLQTIIVRLMQNAYKVENVDVSDFENADLAAAAEKYLLALGMEKSEIEALKVRLK